MKLAIRADVLSEEILRFAQQLGVTHVRILAGPLMEEGQRGRIDPARLRAAVETVRSYDLEVAVALLPLGRNTQFWNACLGRPERDADIENVCRSIETLGRAGVGVAEYVFCLQLGGHRAGWSDDCFGRGGAKLAHFEYENVKHLPAPSPEEETSAEEMWERIEYFLRRVVPAAEAAEVRLACHPDDPPVPRMMGEDRVLGSVEGLKRLIETVPSQSNGVNFCIGTVAEMGVDVIGAIRYFGSRDKINMTHFRNVRGQVPKYEEVFVDEGKLDMAAVVRTLKEVGYTRTLMTDHTPQVIGDSPWGHRGHAFTLGYIRGLLQALA